jgi:hypothetical protein
MSSFYLNTYRPLVFTRAGLYASERQNILPFVDGSIRREPDLEHEYPSMSCLCRAGKFAPRLKEGDIVGYLARKPAYTSTTPYQRLTAVLQIDHVESSHESAADWYRARNMQLPSNCMVDGNPHKLIEVSNQFHRDRKLLDDTKLARRWDAQYRVRAEVHPTFLICRPLFRELSWAAPIVTGEHIQRAFGRRIGTQNPGKLDCDKFMRFLKMIGVSIELFSP